VQYTKKLTATDFGGEEVRYDYIQSPRVPSYELDANEQLFSEKVTAKQRFHHPIHAKFRPVDRMAYRFYWMAWSGVLKIYS
jgi:hypothetical protein